MLLHVLIADHGVFCKLHKAMNSGCCQTAVWRVSSAGHGEWQPCDQQRRPQHNTCSAHQELEERGGPAAAADALGSMLLGRYRMDKVGGVLRAYLRHKTGAACWLQEQPSTPQPSPKPAAAGTPEGMWHLCRV